MLALAAVTLASCGDDDAETDGPPGALPVEAFTHWGSDASQTPVDEFTEDEIDSVAVALRFIDLVDEGTVEWQATLTRNDETFPSDDFAVSYATSDIATDGSLTVSESVLELDPGTAGAWVVEVEGTVDPQTGDEVEFVATVEFDVLAEASFDATATLDGSELIVEVPAAAPEFTVSGTMPPGWELTEGTPGVASETWQLDGPDGSGLTVGVHDYRVLGVDLTEFATEVLEPVEGTIDVEDVELADGYQAVDVTASSEEGLVSRRLAVELGDSFVLSVVGDLGDASDEGHDAPYEQLVATLTVRVES